MKTFNSVADMKAAKLKAGQLVKCKRYYTDGELVEGLEYETKPVGLMPDGFIDHGIANGTTAELIEKNTLTAEQVGCIGNGIYDNAVEVQNCLTQRGSILFNDNNYVIGSSIDLISANVVLGSGRQKTTLTYTGTGSMFRNETPLSRQFDITLRDFTLLTSEVNCTAVDFSSISSSRVESIVAVGFEFGFTINSPTSGFAVYNRFYDVTAQVCTTGFYLTGASSNANIFLSCRTNVCDTGVLMEDSNDNHFNSCQFENGAVGVVITSSFAGLSPKNCVTQCRFETITDNYWNIGAGVSDTCFTNNFYVSSATTPFIDNGIRTQVNEVAGGLGSLNLNSAYPHASGSPFNYTRTTGGDEPLAVYADTNTGLGNPKGIQIENARPAAAYAVRVMSGAGGGATESLGLMANGRIRTNQPTATTGPTPANTSHKMALYDSSGVLIGYIPLYATWA